MENHLLEWFPTNPGLAAAISIGLNIIVAITGVLPSTFITIGTVGVFGFKIGLFILIIGEASGAIVSFFLYRKGLYKLFSAYPKINNIEKNKFLFRLKNTKGITAFFIVILLRILPFVPSGAVTITAALSKIGLFSFSIASTLGKIPAMFIEAYSVSYVLNLKSELQFGLIIFVVILFLFYLLWERKKNINK
ncbi:TVP38/TMEM64 family protein [Cytobacillus kochii]|uniref:TVP38/TMEM64 family protein n=1 Tax=Cytobacillus kochii TaxID=859143 RepID=UPI0025A0227A|nr:VTT domain-containing protein [Cytobacillus kochii]MDM5205377.1 VTT domain-containing protein [Cytobacillus kochii]